MDYRVYLYEKLVAFGGFSSTMYIANRAFSDKLKVQSHLQSPPNIKFGFLKMNKLKTKYLYLAKCKIESLSFSAALLVIY